MDESAESFEVHVKVRSPDENAVELLHRDSVLSKQKIKSAMIKGAVWITRGRKTQRLRRAKRTLKSGDELHLYFDEKVLSEVPAEPQLIADAGGYSVWRKPYGLRSQGSKWGDHCTVARWAETHLQPERPAFTVHRLDRAAEGLILIAHSKGVAAQLAQLFRDREVEKRYIATVSGDFSSHPVPLRIDAPIDGKSAISEFSFVRKERGQSQVDVRIETGRKHQIRRHLADLGHPIAGDRLYGDGADDDVDLQLMAYLLAFHCPIADKPVEYRLTIPES